MNFVNLVVRVQADDFDMATEHQALCKDLIHGAVSTFTGFVRERDPGQLKTITLGHYLQIISNTIERLGWPDSIPLHGLYRFMVYTSSWIELCLLKVISSQDDAP